MPDFSTKKTQSTSLSEWWWMTLALVIFLIFGISTILLQKELRKDQESRSQAEVTIDQAYVYKGISNLTAGTDSYFELNIDTFGQPMDRFYLEFDVLINASYVADRPDNLASNLTLTNSDLKLLDSTVVPFTAPDLSGKTGWHVRVGVASVNFPNATFSFAAPTSVLRFALTAPTTSPLIVRFDQIRTTPFISPSPSPAQVSIPDMIFDVAQIPCVYTYSDWTTCTAPGQQQTRTATVSPSTCPAENPAYLTRACLAQCEYTYSDWATCTNGWQTRTYATSPSQCNWYQAGSLQPLVQQCEEPVLPENLSTYTYEACWNDQSAGNSSYVIWNQIKFPNVTKIDVSTTSSFENFANKDVTNATSSLKENYLATDGTNFRTVSDGKATLWTFWPGYTYYFRLYYGANQHSGVISYFVPKCAGVGGIAYKQCNEACTTNRDCSANLSCVSGQCRRADNTESTICAAQPDKGLNRTCNEYCADNKECGSGYTCWWNRCRLPKNLESTSCSAPVKKTTSYTSTKGDTYYVVPGSVDSAPADITPEMSCGQTCRTNRDCAANLRCYLGACKLSENVTNLKCQTLAEEQASSLSAQLATSPAPSVTMTPVPDQPVSTSNWWSNLAQWLAGRLGFVVLGLLVAVFVILIWPLFRPNLAGSMAARPIVKSTSQTSTSATQTLVTPLPVAQTTPVVPTTPATQVTPISRPAAPQTNFGTPVSQNQPSPQPPSVPRV